MPDHFALGKWGHGLAIAVLAAFMLLVPGHAADAQNITYREVTLGILNHDASFLGGKEKGVDINPELKFGSPIDDATLLRVPPEFQWLVQPRPTIGFTVNTAGFTDQAYVGATWTWQLAGNLLLPGDGITLGFFFGPGLNNGDIRAAQPDRKSLGSNLLFREALEFGYRINAVYTVSAYVDHVSNGGFARYNQSINDFGGRIGVGF